MEIDVTPDGNLEKTGSDSSHAEEENSENPSANATNVSNINLSNSTKEHEKNINTNNNNKKTIKHALRQQAKRRRKNTTIASGNSTSVPRIIVKPLPPQTVEEVTVTTVPTSRTPTMREVLASIPGFTMRPRKRTNKKLSTAAQLEQTKEGCIDLETPDSILVNTNLRHLLNKATFASLPLLYQNKLVQLLPNVDRHIVSNSVDPNTLEINNSGLNNEFFARACLEWQDRLAEGEFTPENQQKLKLEADKERSKLDPWKLKHFEPIWGDRSLDNAEPVSSTSSVNSTVTSNCNTRPPIKTTIKLRPSTTSLTKQSKASAPPPVKRLRTVGAMTRSCTSMKVSELSTPIENKIPIPDLLPIKSAKQVQKDEVQPKAENIVKPDKDLSAPSDNIVELQDKCIVNISDTILKTNEETIIICTTKSDKRRRSSSLDSDQRSPKRKTPSPLAKSPLPTPMDTSEPDNEKPNKELTTEDNAEVASEVLSDDDKISEQMSENALENIDDDTICDYEKDKILDENSSSSSSIITHNIEENSSNETIETVDSLQLHVDYKEDTNQTDETSSTTTTTDAKSEREEQEDSMTSTPDITDVNVAENDPLQLNENENNESQMDEKIYTVENAELHDQESQSQSEMNMEHISENLAQTEKTSEQPNIEDTFQILPNTLILQQESIVIDTKSAACSDRCEERESCIADSAEKLEASVEQCDLVIAQLSETNFENVRSIPDEDDRFIDAENYVLESGQITITTTEKIEKERSEADIEATLFGANVSRGRILYTDR